MEVLVRLVKKTEALKTELSKLNQNVSFLELKSMRGMAFAMKG